MAYNKIISVKDITEESGDPTEPVSLEDVKSYMRIEGLQDVDESLSTSFDEDDELIESLIVTARKKIEKFYGISIVPKTLRVIFNNSLGNIELPHGPVLEILSLKDREGTVIAEDRYTLLGEDYPTIEDPLNDRMTVEYEVGYEEVPEPIKIEIMRMVTWMFENRGNENVKDYQYISGEYNRNLWLL